MPPCRQILLRCPVCSSLHPYDGSAPGLRPYIDSLKLQLPLSRGEHGRLTAHQLQVRKPVQMHHLTGEDVLRHENET